MQKILTQEELPAWRQAQQKLGKKVVVTNGCFDILHVGHLRYLQQAKGLGDVLVIGLNSDISVQQLKGPHRPLNPMDERAEMLAALEIVDMIVPFEEVTAVKFLKEIQPDIYVKGGDYTSVDQLNQEEVQAVRNHGGEIKILPLTPGKSTTNLIEKIQNTPCSK